VPFSLYFGLKEERIEREGSEEYRDESEWREVKEGRNMK
jgi:hypothetical protein